MDSAVKIGNSDRSSRKWQRLLLLFVLVLAVIGAWFSPTLYANYLRSRGASALAQRRVTEAIRWLAQSEKISPLNSTTHFLQARAFRLSGDLNVMKTHLQRAWELGFPVERLKREQLLAVAQLGQLREIESELAELFIAPGEDGREVCEAVVCGMFLTYRLKDAFSILEVWRRDFPEDAQPDIVEGTYYSQSGAWLKAVDCFRRAIRLDSTRYDARVQLAEGLRRLQHLDESERNYRECLKAKPDSQEALIGLGRCRFEQGAQQETEELLQRALKVSPTHPEAIYLLAKLKMAEGHPKTALPLIEKAFSVRPFDPEVRYLFAQVLQATGEMDRAREHFDYLSSQQSAQSKLRNMLEDLEQQPDRVDLRYEVGNILLNYGRPEEGANWLRSVLEFSPKHPGACMLLANYLRSEGHESEADELERRVEPAEAEADNNKGTTLAK